MGWYIAAQDGQCAYCKTEIKEGDKIYFITNETMAHSLCFWEESDGKPLTKARESYNEKIRIYGCNASL